MIQGFNVQFKLEDASFSRGKKFGTRNRSLLVFSACMVLLHSSNHRSKSCHAFSAKQIKKSTIPRVSSPAQTLPYRLKNNSIPTRRLSKLPKSSSNVYKPVITTMGPSSFAQLHLATTSNDSAVISHEKSDKINQTKTKIANTYTLAGILSAIAWISTACVALSFHPDPKFAHCTLRHNLLTMSQALAFPLPISFACFQALRRCALSLSNSFSLDSEIGQRLNLGLAVASFWLAASSAIPTAFAFGYDLYSSTQKIITATIHAGTGLFALKVALRSSSIGQYIRRVMDSIWKLGPHPDSMMSSSGEKSNSDSISSSSLFATTTVGLLYFTIQPIVSPYPLATIPTILGKRLSRPASAFTLLGAILAYCLKTTKGGKKRSLLLQPAETKSDAKDGILRVMRGGLAMGSGAHLFLLFLKIIGVDGGGLIFPGQGLWEVYPAMVNVPFAAGVSIAVHATCLAACFEKNI